jgi:hypothetical protein
MDPIFKEYAILPYAKLMELSKCLFMLSIENGYTPVVFANTWQKNQNRTDHDHNLRNVNQYTLPPPKIELLKNHLFIHYHSHGITWTLQNYSVICITKFKIGLTERLIDALE